MPEKIYTRRGDDGTTQLFYAGPERIRKSDPRPCAYGDADEAVAVLGVARAMITDADLSGLVLRIQRELFVLCAELATEPKNWARLTDGVSRVTTEMVDALEADIDRLDTLFTQPADFIVPGNTSIGAALDHATRVIRRAERSVVALDEVRPEVIRYLNRLADLVWTAARYAERQDAQPRPRES